MLSPRQVKRILIQLEKEEPKLKDDTFQSNDFYINKGWKEALRWVLGKNTKNVNE